ncbi:MAG: hypothetical protein ABIJ39_10935 [Chloroflexota bacterium]
MNKLPGYPGRQLALVALAGSLALSACGFDATPSSPTPPPLSVTASITPSPTLEVTQTPYVITATPEMPSSLQGAYLLSLAEAGYFHLFIYFPDSLGLLRLTTGSWDDITPSTSPDGSRVAFASQRNGYWDLYLLELSSGQVLRLTDTPAYDGAPSWSPDGRWLVYESYWNENLDIYIQSMDDLTQPPIRLTSDPAPDHSPAWSPLGRQIAFVSNRGGSVDIWLADLDRVDAERFTNISRREGHEETHPAWSPDGARLAWGAFEGANGLTGVFVWDSLMPGNGVTRTGSGDWPVWQDVTRLTTRLITPNQSFLAGYRLDGGLSLPPVQVPGDVHGLSYGSFDPALIQSVFQTVAGATPQPLYLPSISSSADIPANRASLIPLEGVRAPYPQLHDAVDESFQALRQRVALELGWDALGSLENAFIPLTTPLDPGRGQDWLYTGRAFSLNPLLENAGWLLVMREDFSSETYWRVFLKPVSQDGSRGLPLTAQPWDFNSRYGGMTDPYERGGSYMTSIPGGYWFDLTSLALQYGWQRQGALPNWRTFYAGSRFSEFAMTQGLDWRTAMLELYPPEVLTTPTAIIPPTRTPTRTPLWYRTPTPTRTPTMRPTFTSGP